MNTPATPSHPLAYQSERRAGNLYSKALADNRRARWQLAGLFLLGLLISVVMLIRSQVGGDQLDLLARGWLLAERGVWLSYGNRTSAGGYEPGGLTSLLVGLPLFVWRDYRAPVVPILLFHVAAYLLLDRVVRDAGTARHRLIFCVVYWLNPWRLFFSGHLWNPNYLLLFSAVHLWTAERLRRAPIFWASCLHSAAIGFACQLHPSPVVLAIASALLVWRGRIKLDWPGALCGAALVAASLLPYAVAASGDRSILPGSQGFPGRGLLLVYPLLRGIMYWFRFSSLALMEKISDFDFAPSFGAAVARPLELALALLQYVAAPLTLIAAVLANRWLAGRVRRRGRREWATRRVWLQGYVAYMFLAAVISYSLSPTTVMAWQCLPVLPAAVLPLVFWAAALSRSRLAAPVHVAGRWWAALSVVLSLASAFGSPVYRSGGRNPHDVPLAEHQLLHDLGLAAQSADVLGVKPRAHSDVLSGR